MDRSRHLTSEELHGGLEHILASPADEGEIRLIVRRPAVDERELVSEARLDPAHGLVGDSWKARGDEERAGRPADPKLQLTLMNARVAELVAGGTERMPLAGDQLYVDLDLSDDNLPPGTRLSIGDAIIEVTDEPHTGCRKFAQRYGKDAIVFVNSGFGRKQNFRGINARVVTAGDIRVGDVARKLG